MTPIGFKQQNVKPSRKKKVDNEPTIIPGTGAFHILNVFSKIAEMEEYMVTKQFSSLTKAKKASVLDAYKFMVTTLAMIQTPVSMTELSGDINPIGFVK